VKGLALGTGIPPPHCPFKVVPPPKIAYFTSFSSLEVSVGQGFRPKIDWEMGFIPHPKPNPSSQQQWLLQKH